ncbi:MAG: ATP-binding protein [Fibrobacteria bacterium]|nr:ATP-binding protein [Fibrobacteria bacterium]
MQLKKRDIEHKIPDMLRPGKVLLLLGARRTGKTVLLNEYSKNLNVPYLKLLGEDFSVIESFEQQSITHYKQLLGDNKILIIDEAQHIPDIGRCLKLIVDNIPEVKVLITGSSAFDLSNNLGEPLTGRMNVLHTYPFSQKEYNENRIQAKANLECRLIYGSYPELLEYTSFNEQQTYLQNLVSSYLFRDILKFENIKHSDKLVALLRLIAFQIGKEVSTSELSTQLGINKQTVDRYLDLLSKTFVIFKLPGFSRNLRKEITKSNRWYFYDNGIRNTLIANVNSINRRDDIGALWENYIMSERIKFQNNHGMLVNNYFWRTYDKQEIDLVEERNGNLFSYEFKWKPKKIKTPIAWKENYPDAEFNVISPDNYLEWIGV